MMKKAQKRWLVIFALVSVLITIITLAFNDNLKTRLYVIESDKISKKVRIALITDLHSCKYGDEQNELIQAIEDKKPDIVLFGGDICDDIVSHYNAETLLKGIAKKYSCYYVTGNHEYWSGDINTIIDLFQSYGVTILNGTYDTIEKNGQKINICGISDPDVTRYTETKFGVQGQLELLKNVHDNGLLTILLAHRPEEIESYMEYGFDLVLAGHAHGGQWRLPVIINGLYAPNQGWFPQYAGGKYTFDSTVMIVSRGLAKESTRVPRIFNRPELVVVDLT